MCLFAINYKSAGWVQTCFENNGWSLKFRRRYKDWSIYETRMSQELTVQWLASQVPKWRVSWLKWNKHIRQIHFRKTTLKPGDIFNEAAKRFLKKVDPKLLEQSLA